VAFLLRDVTDRELSDRSVRRKEQRLLAANLSLRLAHAAAHAASWEWRRGHLLRWLDLGAARELECLPLAWTEDEQIRDWRSIVRLTGPRPYHRAVAALGRTAFASLEIEVMGADEAAHWLRIECAVTERDALGRASRVSGVIVDVTQRKRAEARQQLLVQELNHRVKNMLATVQSIARQSLAGPELGGAAREFESRLMALAWAYEILTREHWAGASLREVAQRTLAPHEGHGSGRVSLSGPDLWLTPSRALSLALALHELATNAVKYGALSNGLGRIDVTWEVLGEDGARRLDLEWTEHGGPPVAAPRRKGFGARLLERSLARELQGEVSLAFDPEGVRCRMRAPLC
jgi:two-component sensor histidine kinase